ncbi:MAG: lysylphosphatidylglycerol synthase transmembrane domain-containing protein [Kosmotogaceae bacterium]
MKTGKELTSSRKNIFWTVLLVLAIGLVVNIVISFIFDIKEVIAVLKAVNYKILLYPFLIFSVIYVIDTIRLKLITSQLRIQISLNDAMYNSIVGYFVSNLTPMASGGQPFQAYHLTTIGVNSEDATNIFMSRFTEFLIFSTVTVILFLKTILSLLRMSGGIASKFIILGLIVAASTVFIFGLLLWKPRVLYHLLAFVDRTFIGKFLRKILKKEELLESFEKWVAKFEKSIAFLWNKKIFFILVDLLLGGTVIFFQALSLYVVLNMVGGINIGIWDLFLLFLTLNLVVYYIPSPGASGSVEGVYNLVLSGLAFNPSKIVAGVIVWRFATFYFHIFFEIIYLVIHNFWRKSSNVKNCSTGSNL